MRQGQQNRRSRGRGRKQQNPLARNYESNGPDVKIRGTANHIAEKYASLARDMLSSGDMVTAENYLQHAEHYTRIIMAAQAQHATKDNAEKSANGSRGEVDEDVNAVAAGQADSAQQDETVSEDNAGGSAASSQEAQAPRRGRRRSNSNGRKNANGEDRKSGRNSSDGNSDASTPGEFAGLPPSISNGKPRSKAASSSEQNEDARENSDVAAGDAAPDALAS